MKVHLLALAAAALLAGCAAPPVNRDAGVALGGVAMVEPARYAGRWYEIARFPNAFERGCAGVTADYVLRPDGRLSVRNTCREGAPDGRARVAEGVARIVDARTNARLRVSFFGPFEGDYWVLDRAPDYAWSLVGEPSGRYLWILARTPTITDDVRRDLLARLGARGYRVAALEWTAQAH